MLSLLLVYFYSQLHPSLKHSQLIQCRVAGSVINASLVSRKYLIKVIVLVIKSLSLQIHVLLGGVCQLNIINYTSISV